MSIETEYESLCMCDECDAEILFVKGYDANDIENIAIENGWMIKGGYIGLAETNHHVCPDCLEKTK